MLGVLDPHIWLVGIRGNLFFVFPATRLAIHPQSRKAKSIGARHKLTSTLSPAVISLRFGKFQSSSSNLHRVFAPAILSRKGKKKTVSCYMTIGNLLAEKVKRIKI
jgi:hypothetical protein